MKCKGISDAGFRRIAKAMGKCAAQVTRTAVGETPESGGTPQVAYFDDGYVLVSTGGPSSLMVVFDGQGNIAGDADTQSHTDDWQSMFQLSPEESGALVDEMTSEDFQWIELARSEFGGDVQEYQQQSYGLTPGVRM